MNCEVLLGADSYRKPKPPRNILRNHYQCPSPPKTGRTKEVEDSPFRFITEFDLPGHPEKDGVGGQMSKRSVLPDHLQTEDPPFDDDLNEETKEPRLSPSQLCYSAACKMMKVTPIKYFFDGLRKNSIIMKNHLLGYSGARTCAIALTKNCNVSILTLEGNKIGGRGAACIGQTIGENFCITELSLADNGLCSLGAKSICEALRTNRSVRKLNLAGNGFKERDAVHFRELLEENNVLIELNISHNEFREVGGETLAEGLCYNDSLQSLNLSWNHLRLKGAIAIGNSLQENNGLENLNLAWNGFHIEGSTALGQSLCCNKTLKELDLTCNRIYEYCLPPLVDALEKNNTLEVLRLGYNSLGMDGSMSIIQVIESGSSIINDLDLGMQCVSTEFVDSEKRIAIRRPFRTTHGVVLSPTATYDGENQRDSRLFEGDNPMLVLMEFMRLQNLRLVDLFSTLDKNSDHQITHDEIRAKLQSTSVPLSDTAIERLIVRLDTDNSGTIDFGELFAGQKEHKIMVQKLLSRAEGTWEDTTIGKISIKLQHVMDKQLIMRSKERAAAERYQREDEERRLRIKRRQDEIERVKREAAQQQLLMKEAQH